MPGTATAGSRGLVKPMTEQGRMVGATGFEPATSWTQTKCSSRAELRSDAGRNIGATLRRSNAEIPRAFDFSTNSPYFFAWQPVLALHNRDSEALLSYRAL